MLGNMKGDSYCPWPLNPQIKLHSRHETALTVCSSLNEAAGNADLHKKCNESTKHVKKIFVGDKFEEPLLNEKL